MDSQTMNKHGVKRTLSDASAALPLFAGMASFGSALACSSYVQLAVFGISTGSPRPIPTVFGIASVCLASLVSHQAALVTCARFNQDRHPWSVATGQKTKQNPLVEGMFEKGNENDFLTVRKTIIPLQPLRICIVGLVVFKILGGRFWAVAPSSVTHVGSFATKRLSIPATSRYGTKAEREIIQTFGRQGGCHTCGKTRAKKYICDHMPPKSVAAQMEQKWFRKWFNKQVSYRFYPQCNDCSNRQGGILNQAVAASSQRLAGAGGGTNAHFHGMRPRWNHFTGSVIAAVTFVPPLRKSENRKLML